MVLILYKEYKTLKIYFTEIIEAWSNNILQLFSVFCLQWIKIVSIRYPVEMLFLKKILLENEFTFLKTLEHFVDNIFLGLYFI